MKVTQKELIDYCTSSTAADCITDRCKYLKACRAYFRKYGGIPDLAKHEQPELYTDEVIWSDEEAKKDD